MSIQTTNLVIAVVVLFSFRPAHAQESAGDLLDRGYDLYEDGQYDQAIRVFEKAALLDSSNAEIFYLMGVSRSLNGDNDGALKNYERALKLKPEYAEVYYEIGYSNFLQGNTEEALKGFNQAIAIREEYPEAYLNRGSVKCMMGDKEGAEKDWEVAKKYGMSLPQAGCD